MESCHKSYVSKGTELALESDLSSKLIATSATAPLFTHFKDYIIHQ